MFIHILTCLALTVVTLTLFSRFVLRVGDLISESPRVEMAQTIRDSLA